MEISGFTGGRTLPGKPTLLLRPGGGNGSFIQDLTALFEARVRC
jgi:hypothetical protein